MIRHGMLYDRQTQPRAARFFGVALVHTVKTFKDAALMFNGNTDTRVAYFKDYFIRIFFESDSNAASLFVVADSVVAKVVYDFLKVPAYAVHNA